MQSTQQVCHIKQILPLSAARPWQGAYGPNSLACKTSVDLVGPRSPRSWQTNSPQIYGPTAVLYRRRAVRKTVQADSRQVESAYAARQPSPHCPFHGVEYSAKLICKVNRKQCAPHEHHCICIRLLVVALMIELSLALRSCAYLVATQAPASQTPLRRCIHWSGFHGLQASNRAHIDNDAFLQHQEWPQKHCFAAAIIMCKA